MDFLSLSSEAAFVILVKLAIDSTIFERKTIKYFVLGFYQSFLPPVKAVLSFDLAKPFPFSFCDFHNFFYN